MIRAFLTSAFAVSLLVLGCSSPQSSTGGTNPGRATGGSGGTSAGSGGSGGSRGGSAGSTGGSTGESTGGTGGSGGSSGSGGTAGSGDDGGSSATGGTSGAGGAGGATGVDAGTGGSGDVDAPVAVDGASASDGGMNGPGPGVVPLPGKTGDYICPLTATHEQCCTMLCECVNRICTDSPKAKPGLAGCMPTCMKLSEMLTRCHVYHCYESVSPSGVKDHDSHCGHAANQVNGGGCPVGVN